MDIQDSVDIQDLRDAAVHLDSAGIVVTRVVAEQVVTQVSLASLASLDLAVSLASLVPPDLAA